MPFLPSIFRPAPPPAPRVPPASSIIPPIKSPSADLKGGISPVSFFAEVDVDPGSEAIIRGDALSNRTGEAIEIHEIRLDAISPLFDSGSGAGSINAGSFLAVKMMYGDKKITNSYVPIWLIGKTDCIPGEEFTITASVAEARSLYVWKLKKPMHLTAKNPIAVSFQHTGGFRQKVTAQINLVGRVVDKAPTTTTVPYAASYSSRSFGYSELGYDESNERDLVNGATKRVCIERIVGRVSTPNSLTAGIPTVFTDHHTNAQNVSTLLRLDSSNGMPIIRDYSQFRTVFGYSRSIDVPFYLDPGEFLRARIKNTPGANLGGSAFLTYYAQAQIGIVGSREEVV